MELDTVIGNLDNTIAGKAKLLAELEKMEPTTDATLNMANNALRQFLRINLTELNNIRDHLMLVQDSHADTN